jgi:LPXTG-site transpeptidase (sortase) family protein
MWSRILAAIGVIVVFFLLATQTPLEKWVFQYKGQPASSYDVINQIQVIENDEEVQEIEKIHKDIAEKKHQNKSKPVKLEIPSLEVSAPIYGVGLTKNGAMATLDGPTVIAWYKYSSIPGQEGNAILAGHRDWNGALGTLFYLETMKKGDKLIITFEDGHTETFQLESNHLYHQDHIPEHVMDLDGESRVTVITCAGKYIRGNGGYQSRAVAVFKKIND